MARICFAPSCWPSWRKHGGALPPDSHRSAWCAARDGPSGTSRGIELASGEVIRWTEVEATNHAFFPFSAEWLFLQILKGYFNEHTTAQQIAVRAERKVAHMVMNGASWAQAEMARRQMHAYLSDRKLVFDRQYRQFFFVDEHPEIAERFRMTFESCFQEAGDDESQR